MTFNKREIRTRSKVRAVVGRPRLSVHKSNKYLTAQLIDDEKSITLVYVSGKGLGKAREIGKTIAEKANKLKVKKIVFDKGGYSYHGKIKAIADGAREGGLEF